MVELVSAWHDPRGRLVVDGNGREVRRETESDREERVPMWPTGWSHCRRCVAVFPSRDVRPQFTAPHSCRPEHPQ